MESRGDGSWRLETGGLTRGSRECSPILSGSETRFCAPPNSRNQIKPSRPCLSFHLLTLFVEEAMAAVPSLAMQLPHDQHPKESGKCAALQRGFRPFPDITPTYSREPCDLAHPPIGNGPSSSLVITLAFISPLSFPVRSPWSVANTKAIESSDTDLLNPSSELAPTCVLPG